MRLLFNLEYYLVMGFALLILVKGLMPEWSEIRFAVLYFGSLILFFFSIGVLRGVLHERKMRRGKEGNRKENAV